ncbi:MurR/RpiR family transcriptional regulator [Kyrpidia sp.]|uniref:MurR/RpiR family transcriptional regulator n=1 Tax=Kyrpidia sp. TaxID=2073077 RepID=UPI00258F7F9E|nr:MurR/RpiR family transcriptional regulator [Kyrpidia sp.]MCL6575141.1 MurR/RpiR family transcriptional regulator [Kyrpidia sp.]
MSYDKLSPAQQKVAEYLLQNMEKASYETAVQIARGAGVSEATVVRLAYALGYNSFSEVQRHLRQQVLKGGRSRAPGQTVQADTNPLDHVLARDAAVIQGLRETLVREDVDRAVGRIIEADQVLVVGFRGSYAAAQWFFYTLGMMREGVSLIPSDGGNLAGMLSLTERSAVVGISFPRYAAETLRLVGRLKEQGSSIIAITDKRWSPLGRLADIVLAVEANYEAGTLSPAGVMSLLNLLVAGVGDRDPERVRLRMQRLEELYSGYGIMVE